MTSRRVFLALAAARVCWAGTVRLCGVRFRSISNGRSNRRYVWIHGDETTAGEVLATHMEHYRGLALLVDNPTRVIRSGTLTFDPNRMFSGEGLERNLRKLNPEASVRERQRILTMVARDREALVKRLTPPPGGLLIALHNNSRGYSVQDEIEMSNDVSLREPDAPNDFLLSTDPGDFARLKTSPFNAVLQNRAKSDDDGSLSRLAAARRIRYVNIEAGIGRAEKQKTMLEWLERNL